MHDRTSAAPESDSHRQLLRPDRILSVGVTGHRLDRLGDLRLEEVAQAIDDVLGAITAAANGPGAGGSSTTLRMISGFADGADSIAADAAHARGWTLDAVLPFARENFATSFAPGEALAAYDLRLDRARAVFELPGERLPHDARGTAYERVGRIVLAQSDLLVAVWDLSPARGAGGAAHVIAAAVIHGIPVIHIDPTGATPARLMWAGLDEHDLGTQTIETVACGPLDALPALVASLIDLPDDPADLVLLDSFLTASDRKPRFAVAWPLLLSVMGARRRRHPNLADTGTVVANADPDGGFMPGVRAMLAARFARADHAASGVAQRFRSGYVTNFGFAALAVILSLLGLALPTAAKPVLVVLELTTIGVILLLTRWGNRANWHRRWLDDRHLAERLRCLAISSQLGNLDLRRRSDSGDNWVCWYARATARAIGLPSVKIDAAYLDRVRASLIALIDDQVAYLNDEAVRMHRLEHRLHTLGTVLFAMTGIICVGLLGFEIVSHLVSRPEMSGMAHGIALAATMLSASLPALGAAIYGIRMQGDFAGIAERGETLSHHLTVLRTIVTADDRGFDTLARRIRRVEDLLTEDLANWLHAYHARPLVLPG